MGKQSYWNPLEPYAGEPPRHVFRMVDEQMARILSEIRRSSARAKQSFTFLPPYDESTSATYVSAGWFATPLIAGAHYDISWAVKDPLQPLFIASDAYFTHATFWMNTSAITAGSITFNIYSDNFTYSWEITSADGDLATLALPLSDDYKIPAGQFIACFITSSGTLSPDPLEDVYMSIGITYE